MLSLFAGWQTGADLIVKAERLTDTVTISFPQADTAEVWSSVEVTLSIRDAELLESMIDHRAIARTEPPYQRLVGLGFTPTSGNDRAALAADALDSPNERSVKLTGRGPERAENMLKFDDRDTWWPELTAALDDYVDGSVRRKVLAGSPEYFEDAGDFLLSCSDRAAVVDAAINWVSSSVVAAYHGTRLTNVEIESVWAHGLKPLMHTGRQARLENILSRHARWPEVQDSLDQCLRDHGPGKKAGRREGQVHLTLSRRGLVEDFNHYLTHGSEFDRHVAHFLLGDEGLKLLRSEGQARVIALKVPGRRALEAANPHLSVDDLRRRGEVPNLVREFLRAWSYGFAHPELDCGALHVDCGLVFSTPVPWDWIDCIDTLTI